jgi:hypothetical protein
MAPNNDASKVTDKGKGKAVDSKPDESKKGKDAQPSTNGKKDDNKVDGRLHSGQASRFRPWANVIAAPEELSEEDQQLKSELDMLVERLMVGTSPRFCRCAVIQLLTIPVGIRCLLIQASPGGHEDLDQDLDVLDDCSAKAPKVPKTTLRANDEAV